MKKFPLAPLVKLRAQAVETCRETLQEADLHLQKAQQAQAHAELTERQHDAGRRAVEEAEAQRLAVGDVLVRDLNQMADYEAGARAEALRLRQHNQTQAQKMRRAEQSLAEASQALAEARAEQRVVERRQERFEQTERAVLDARVEEEAQSNWQVRKVPC